MENFKFYVMQGSKEDIKFYLRKVICLEVKANKLKIDKSLSLEFVGSEQIDSFRYNFSFFNSTNKTTFKGFKSLEDLNAFVKANKNEILDLRKNNDD